MDIGTIEQLNPWNNFQWIWNHNTTISTHENAFENVACIVAVILSWPQYVNQSQGNVLKPFYVKLWIRRNHDMQMRKLK